MQCLGGGKVQPTEGYAMNGWFPPSRMIVSYTYVDLTGGSTVLFNVGKLRTSYGIIFVSICQCAYINLEYNDRAKIVYNITAMYV